MSVIINHIIIHTCIILTIHISVPAYSDTTSDEDADVFFFPDEVAQARNRRLKVRSKSTCEPIRRPDENKSPVFTPMPALPTDDLTSINTETRELLDFETFIMSDPTSSTVPEGLIDDLAFEPNPQVAHELGNISNKKRTPATAPIRKVSSDTDDEFCIIGDEERPRCGFETVPINDEPIRIVDNHFFVPEGKADLMQAPPNFPMAVKRYTLCEFTFTWHMYGGQDFPSKTVDPKARYTNKTASSSSGTSSLMTSSTSPGSLHRMSDTYRMGVSYSKGSPNVVFGKSPNTHGGRQGWKQRGGPFRRLDVLVQVNFTKLRYSYEVYPITTKQASRHVLLLRKIEIRDRMACSQIKKCLYFKDDELMKGTQHVCVIKSLHLRPDLELPAETECSLRISMRDIRLNIDQDTLLFLIEFSGNIAEGFAADGGPGGSKSLGHGRRSSSASASHHEPVMKVELPEQEEQLERARQLLTENLNLLIDDELLDEVADDNATDTDDRPTFFK